MFRKHVAAVRAGDLWLIDSAGTWAEPGLPPLSFVIDAAKRFGIDLEGHRSVGVSGPFMARYDLILVMQASQKEGLQSEFPEVAERTYLFSEVVEHRSYDIPDGKGSRREVMDVAVELHSLLQRGLESICVLATYLSNMRSGAY